MNSELVNRKLIGTEICLHYLSSDTDEQNLNRRRPRNKNRFNQGRCHFPMSERTSLYSLDLLMDLPSRYR